MNGDAINLNTPKGHSRHEDLVAPGKSKRQRHVERPTTTKLTQQPESDHAVRNSFVTNKNSRDKLSPFHKDSVGDVDTTSAGKKKARREETNNDDNKDNNTLFRSLSSSLNKGLHFHSKWFFHVGRGANPRSHGHSTKKGVPWSREHFEDWVPAGQGGFGHVFLARDRDDQSSVAIKLLSKKELRSSGNALQLARREVEIHSRLGHSNILIFHGYFHDPKHVCMVLEPAECDLYRILNAYPKGLSLDHASGIVRQVASALAYLAHHQVAHRDIKPENILLSSFDATLVKVGDFGWAVHVPPPHMRHTLCGTAEYVPPEIVSLYYPYENQEADYDARYVDAWALGVLAYEFVMGKTPFCVETRERTSEESDDTTLVDTFTKICAFGSVEFDQGKNLNSTRGTFFRDFCNELLQRNPTNRMSTADALRHPWLCPDKMNPRFDAFGKGLNLAELNKCVTL